MFETISGSRPRRPAAGTAVSVALHAAVIGAVVWVTARHVHTPPIIEFVPVVPPRPPQGAPPPPPAPVEKRHHGDKTRHRKTDIVQPAAVEAAKTPPEAAVEDESGDDELPGEPGGEAGGIPGGVPGGTPGGVIGSTEIAPGPMPFEEGRMTPPQRLSGPDPEYTVPALEHEIEGVMSVRCVVNERGAVHGCRVLKSLPYMDAAVIRALEQRRYTPATIGGRPVEVDYLFQVRLRLP